jgi:ATP-binding cassette subfamily B (MDR/TAP) protein 1
MVISCIIGWKLGLVCSSTIPVLLLGGFSKFWVLSNLQSRAEKAYRKSASVACEAVSDIETVAAFALEDYILSIYSKMLSDQLARSLRSVIKTSLLYAASQSLILLCMALGFWYGGTLIEKGEYSLF